MSNIPIQTILYAKGWYKRRGDITTRWMDLAHTINADGYSGIYTKKDVAMWLLHRYEEFAEKLLHHDKLTKVMFDMLENKRRIELYDHIDNVSDEDAIIYTVCSYFLEIDSKDIPRYTKPCDLILPFNYASAWVENTHGYSSKPRKWHPADMRCDIIQNIEKVFKDADEFDTSKLYSSFEDIESRLNGVKSWQDFVTLPGEDSLLTCIEVNIAGSDLNESKPLTFENSDYFIDKGIYHNYLFDSEMCYTCRVELDKTTDIKQFVIKSIIDEHIPIITIDFNDKKHPFKFS